MDRELLKRVARKLKEKDLTIAVAESCTGGLISYALTSISGSSKYFKYSCVPYSNQAKIEHLKVPKKMIDNFGAVSQEVALTMAEKVKEKGKVDIGLGITGIAGPTGGSKEKPVGLVYIALSTKKENICKKFNFKGNREEIRKKSSQKALEMILEI